MFPYEHLLDSYSHFLFAGGLTVFVLSWYDQQRVDLTTQPKDKQRKVKGDTLDTEMLLLSCSYFWRGRGPVCTQCPVEFCQTLKRGRETSVKSLRYWASQRQHNWYQRQFYQTHGEGRRTRCQRLHVHKFLNSHSLHYGTAGMQKYRHSSWASKALRNTHTHTKC